MKKYLPLALAFLISPAAGASDLEAALSRVPSIADLCGAVPVAPAKVLGNSVHHPVRRSVKAFIQDTNEWLDCAADKYVRIQELVDDIQDSWQRSVLVDHMNADFRTQYEALNIQTELLATRVNYRLAWQVSPIQPATKSSGRGLSNSAPNRLLQRTKQLTLQADINRPIYDPSLRLLRWEPLEALQLRS